MKSHSDSPTRITDRLFRRFAAIWGVQKIGAMFPADDLEVRSTWEQQLLRFPLPVVGQALQALIDAGSEWPPTLSEFISTCKQFNHQAHQAGPEALPPLSVTESAAAAQMLQSIAQTVAKPAGFDYLSWARRPKSAQAVRLLQRGAEHEPRLRELLRQHLANNGENCQTPEAVDEILAIKRSGHVAL